MCGIAGALSLDGSFRVTPGYIEAMRDSISHRGPDGVGMWISDDGRVGFGFRRLAIIDLSDSANQPMVNEDGSLRLLFNGEIYNHADIRAELEQLGGHTWTTDHSDAEVVLHAFETWGIAALERFRGMFAIALWDSRQETLWLIRDRIGIKPLYYSVHHGRLTFASEIKSLLTDVDQPRSVDEDALFHYLSFLTTPAPNTMFEGIKKLPAGTWVRIDREGQIQERRWWDVWDHVDPLVGVSEAEITERVREELRTAIRLHKVSDVPVGVFLSGGIDSSTNLVLFSEGEGEPVNTFSIAYDQDYTTYPSELPFARRIAKDVGASYHELVLTQDDLLSFLPRMVQLQDEPLADPVCMPIYYLSKLARDSGVVVAQVGEGADELFCGYPAWRTALRLEALNSVAVPMAIKKLGLAAMRATRMDGGMRYEWLRRGVENEPVFWGGAEAFTQRTKERLLSRRLRGKFAGHTSWSVLAPIYERFTQRAWEASHLNWMTYLDLNLRLPELLLMRVDKMSMGVGVESRVPFLDHKFVELVLSIPTSLKTKRGELKYVLKRAVRGLIPDELIDRPKQGFNVPVLEWFGDRLGDQVRQDLREFSAKTDFLDRDEVDRLLSRGQGREAWYLHNLAKWWFEYVA